MSDAEFQKRLNKALSDTGQITNFEHLNRVEQLISLEKIIQSVFDDYNFYGYSELRDNLSDFANAQYKKMTGQEFIPVYNCPA